MEKDQDRGLGKVARAHAKRFKKPCALCFGVLHGCDQEVGKALLGKA